MLLRGEALPTVKLSHPMQQHQLPGASISVGAAKNEASKLLERIQRLSENTFVLKTVESTSSSSSSSSSAVRNVVGSQIRSGSLKVVSEANAVDDDATRSDQPDVLTIGPESIILQKVSSTNRYEAYVNISLGLCSTAASARVGAVEVRLQSSVAFLRLSKSQVTMSTGYRKER
jgi:hypothetical protein